MQFSSLSPNSSSFNKRSQKFEEDLGTSHNSNGTLCVFIGQDMTEIHDLTLSIKEASCCILGMCLNMK